MVFFIGECLELVVSKVINNNIVSCIGDDGHEVIAMGRGLGFFCRPGTEITPSRVEKTFSVDTENSERAKKLLSSLPEKHIDISMKIIEYAGQILGCRLNDNVYITLTDHISFAISRHLEGASMGSALMSEVKVFYPREYTIGKYAVSMIREELGVSLPEDEACSIALHITNAEFSTNLNQIVRITKAIGDIRDIITRETGLDSFDGIAGSEFISFLKFFVFRCFSEEKSDIDDGGRLMRLAEGLGGELVGVSSRIVEYIEENTKRGVSLMDRAFLAVNIYWFGEYTRRNQDGTF